MDSVPWTTNQWDSSSRILSRISPSQQRVRRFPGLTSDDRSECRSDDDPSSPSGQNDRTSPPYPFVPILALTPLPLLAFILLYYHPTILSSSSSFSLRGTFRLAYIPTAILTCIMAPLFSRTLTLSDIPLAILFFYVLRPSISVPRSPGMGKSASEPVFRLFQGYLNTILSNPESRKIFYFLVVNMAYMLVQMLYGVWTNSLGLISDGKSLRVSSWNIYQSFFSNSHGI